jgi:hypothetical protein
MCTVKIVWCMLLRQAARLPFSLAEASAGSSRAAKMAMMAITTNNSIRVNPRFPAPRNLRFRKVCINGFLSGTASVCTFTGLMAIIIIGHRFIDSANS